MTDLTADAAKLLPCPFPWRGDDGSRSECIKKGHCGCGATIADICDAIAGDPPSTPSGRHDDWQHGWQDGAMECAATIRARAPAPPEGDADFRDLADKFTDDKDVTEIGEAALCAAFGEHMYRLGLAARPKVEDDPAMVELEVATAIQTLLDSNMKPIAYLLERLADDLQNWWSAAIVAMKAQEAAEAKLAEREAELVKADAVISFYHDFDHYEGGRLATADEEKWDEEATQRHAARQQQKDKA